jgi:hypothetical protein
VVSGSSPAQRGSSRTVVSLVMRRLSCGVSSEKYSTSLPKPSTRLVTYDGAGSICSWWTTISCQAHARGRMVARC